MILEYHRLFEQFPQFRLNQVEILGYKSVCTLEKKVKINESYSLNYLKY